MPAITSDELQVTGLWAEIRRTGKALAWLVGIGRAPRRERPVRSYAEARDALVKHLTQDATAHDEGRFHDIGGGYDNVAGSVPQRGGREWRDIYRALAFWDGWIDAKNHAWLYYEPIRREDWPVLARRIAGDLANGRKIIDPAPPLLREFGIPAEVSPAPAAAPEARSDEASPAG